MTYSLIADIHGNITALKAVLADAKAQGADGYIFLGDYCQCFEAPNEVVDAMLSVENSYFVSGNGDDYIIAARKMKPQIDGGQWTAVAWCVANMRPENIDFLERLPEKLAISHRGLPDITAFHKPDLLFPGTAADINPSFFAKCIDDGVFSRESFPDYFDGMMSSDERLGEIVRELPDGIYIMGHQHIQWQWRSDSKLLIATGSCGNPIDFDQRAAYALLRSDGDSWVPELRRVKYDVDASLERLLSSDYAEHTPVWSRVMYRENATARLQAVPFLKFCEKYADEIGDERRPYVKETWRAAFALWNKQNEVEK